MNPNLKEELANQTRDHQAMLSYPGTLVRIGESQLKRELITPGPGIGVVARKATFDERKRVGSFFSMDDYFLCLFSERCGYFPVSWLAIVQPSSKFPLSSLRSVSYRKKFSHPKEMEYEPNPSVALDMPFWGY